ncbi:TonB-dependent receptor [Coraliomargarita parva]|uniref:TonB-dependent receptor n=1 Tax=Coraliomargarita parva TaxID=3014050 RepID=UPI0022B55AEA|nr:TonB-dependent receptor [Coraliomargarita parva]
MNKYTNKIILGMATCLLSGPAVFAQDAPAEEDTIVLEEMEVDEVPIEESILATTRPITSVYGTERSILDTPRNVNIVSREQLDAISIKDVRDFSKLTSSSYTKSNFGAPTTPNLRGQEADLFINGMRRGHSTNGNGVPINFNSVESVNIVKGPAGAVYGTSNYVGGYADLVTKRAYFEEGGSVEYTYGSFDQHTLDLDVNMPISETLAARVSFQGKEWEGFWDNWYQKSQAIYATLAWKPNDKYRLDVMAEFYKGNYTENWGINRATQSLIDDGEYLPNIGSDADYASYVTGASGYRNYIPVDLDNPVSADREWKLSAPGDDSNATVFWAQAIQEFNVSEDLKLTNNTYFHYKDRSTWSSYHYSEMMRDNWSLENRFQVLQDFEPEGMAGISLNYGVRVKYQEIWSVNHYYNEPANFWDLTRSNSLINIPEDQFYGGWALSDESGRNGLSRWYVGTGEAVDTETWIIGPFAQADIKFTDRLSLLAGYTLDYVDHFEAVPDEIVGIDDDGLEYKLDEDLYNGDDYDATLFNVNASFVFKPTEESAVYLTYNEGKHFSVGTGGAITASSLDDDLGTKLYELGSNISFFDNKMYLGAALFRQEYTSRNQDGSTSFIKTDGFEVELNYQPNRNFYATVGYSYLDSKSSGGFYATGYSAEEAYLTGGTYVSPTFPTASGKEFETPGVPKHLFNALAQYQWDNGFGVQANVVVTGPMNSGYEGYTFGVDTNGDYDDDVFLEATSLRTDWQYEVDAKIFYEYENWRFEFSIFNVTDEENWDLPNSGYGNGSIVARPERSYEVSVKYSW